MKKLLDSKPDVETFLESRKLTPERLKTLGINSESITTLKDITDLMIVIKALSGDSSAKSYIDEQYDREASLEAMNASISPS
jgi:hypothetical protein